MDGGNLFFGKGRIEPFELEQRLKKAEVVLAAYHQMGVDAVALGNLDFAAGLEILRTLQQQAAFPLLCANLVDKQTNEPIFPPYTIVDRGGVRVGIIGILDSSRPPPGLGAAGNRLRIAPEYEALKHWGRKLRRELGCDLVVSLSTANRKRFRLPAKQLPHIALYITGEPRDRIRAPTHYATASITSTGHLGKYLGRCVVEVDAETYQARMVDNEFIPLKPELPEDPAVQVLVDGYFNFVAMARKNGASVAAETAESTAHLRHGHAVYVSDRTCRSCHPEHHARWADTRHARALQDLPAGQRSRFDCLECHVTGFGQRGGYGGPADDSILGGVQCEVCHGPGSLHPAGKTLARGPQLDKACRSCHTRSRSPNFKLSEYRKRLPCVSRDERI